jgi:2-oxoglutarate dehydrogenase E2 component (dihydrolipoamide succinyltransferase)
MSIDVTVPSLGESIVEATVGRWLKQEGDTVAQGDALVELETDKVNMEVTATGSGILASIIKTEGETVEIGDVIATLNELGAATAPQAHTAPAAAVPVVEATAETQENGTSADAIDGGRSTPLARRIATEHGIDIAHVPGTGPSGRVTKEDVSAYLAQQSTPAQAQPATPAPVQPARPTPPPPAPVVATSGTRSEERVRLSRRRQTIARRLVEAQHNAAMLTTFNEVDMSAIMEIRKQKRDEFKERNGVGLGYMSFFTKAVVSALKAFPRLNAEIQGDDMILKQYYDIGIAVSTDDGLVVPVLRDADSLSFAQIERGIASLATRARSKELTLPELQGGTFTITNGGIFGSMMSTPIINAPQVGILGMHKIMDRPMAVNGQVQIRPMMYLAVSYDHRIVDGAESVRFLVHVKDRLEDPVSLLLE